MPFSMLPAVPLMCAKRALASSAAFAASRGRMNTLGTESMAATDRISLEHLARTSTSAGRSQSPMQVTGLPQLQPAVWRRAAAMLTTAQPSIDHDAGLRGRGAAAEAEARGTPVLGGGHHHLGKLRVQGELRHHGADLREGRAP